MSDQNDTKEVNLIYYLSDLIADSSTQSIEEVHQELLDMGIDGKDFTAKIKEKVASAVEKERLSWIENARKEMSQAFKPAIASKTVPKDRASIVSILKEKIIGLTNAGYEVPEAYFHKFEYATNEDLLTIIEDLEQLEAKSKKKE